MPTFMTISQTLNSVIDEIITMPLDLRRPAVDNLVGTSYETLFIPLRTSTDFPAFTADVAELDTTNTPKTQDKG